MFIEDVIISLFRSSIYQVDLRAFKKNSSINIEEVVKEVTEGNGYYILKGLFDADDIRHARETILYLISKQGKKATHFQVLFIVCIYVRIIVGIFKLKSLCASFVYITPSFDLMLSQGQEDSKEELQARVWNLLNKGPIFEKLVRQ